MLFVREGLLRAWLRRRSFVANLLINGTALMVLFLVMRGLGQVVTSGEPARFVTSFGDAHLRYAIPFFAVLAFGLQVVVQMNRMIGANVVRYFLTGVYHHPRNEERIFMFLDMESSTELAERLGGLAYYELLRRFVDDLSEPILESRGEIYKYAGDEIIVTWASEAGRRNANCVRCYFRIEDAVARNAPGYERDFGTVPKFRAGLHGGPVVAGELGDLRHEIVFAGDTINTAARLEDYAREHERRFVVSGDLLDHLELPYDVRAERLEEFRARGKAGTITVYGLTRDGASSTAGTVTARA
jgi:adenylate cyclase